MCEFSMPYAAVDEAHLAPSESVDTTKTLPGDLCAGYVHDNSGSDDGSTDDGSTDDGSTDDGSTDDGSTDDGSSDDPTIDPCII